MTDATMGGGGGVGIRLFVSGGEVVRRTFDQVAGSGKKMWAEIAMGEKAANPSLRAMSRVSGDLQGEIQSLASRAGVAGNALSAFGATGVALAAGLGGLAVALVKTREAMAFAADLTDTADRIGIGVEALQQWRFAADEAGVPVEALQADLEKLNGVLGKFKAGIGDAKLKPWFEELGIDKAQLDTIQTADQLMLLLADRLGQVSDRSKQVAAARAFGIEASLPILRQGADGIREYQAEAERLGLVMGKDVVQALDEADRKMEIAQQRIDMSLKLAVADLADDFAGLVTEIASVVAWLSRLSQIKIENPGAVAGQYVNDMIRRVTGNGRNAERVQRIIAQDGGSVYDGRRITVADMLELTAGHDRSGYETRGHTTGGGRGGGDSAARKAEREAEQRRQRERQARDRRERLEADLERDVYALGNVSQGTRTAGELAALERDRVTRLRDIAEAEQDYIQSKGLKGLTEAEAALLRTKTEELVAARRWDVQRREQEDVLKRRLKDEEDASESARALLEVQAGLIRSGRDRVAIERQILVEQLRVARLRRRAELEADPELSGDDVAARMNAFSRQSQGQLALFDHNAREGLREEFRSYGMEVVDAIESGRIGETIAGELKDKLLEMALNGLFDFLNPPGGQGSGGGWMGKVADVVAGLFGGGRAGGGGARPGFRYGMAETGRPELLMLGAQGQVTSAAETARMLRDVVTEAVGPSRSADGDLGRLEVEILPHRDFDVRVRRVAREEARAASTTMGAHAVRTSVSAAPQAVADRHAYRE